MRKILFFIAFSYTAAFAQPKTYSTTNAHSHNDYQQSAPLYSAYSLGFGSIEVDVMLANDELLVAHTQRDIPQRRLLEEIYLKPIQGYIQTNKGYPYADTSRTLILMLDIKSDAIPTLNKIIDVLQKYPELTRTRNFKVLISGNKPDPNTYISYPSFVVFDGLLSNRYSKEAMGRIAMLSDNFIAYSNWKGNGPIPPKVVERLKKLIDRAHELGKEVRLWNVPDFDDAWSKVIELGVDYIDSDSIKALASFLKKQQQKTS
ncbi:alkaline phosphatase [Longitalea arenae]|uniref:alkaline phosphatase n=1 Tax=Longitalea arenae TaxID=2812558 RepID=UPI001967E8E4|nr:alkaline phosphatase [Longitalea arenae]